MGTFGAEKFVDAFLTMGQPPNIAGQAVKAPPLTAFQNTINLSPETPMAKQPATTIQGSFERVYCPTPVRT